MYSREEEPELNMKELLESNKTKKGPRGDQSWKNRDDILSESVHVSDRMVGWRLTDPYVGTLCVSLAEAEQNAWQYQLSRWSGRQGHLLWVRGVCQVGVSRKTLTPETVYY